MRKKVYRHAFKAYNKKIISIAEKENEYELYGAL